MIIQPNKLNVAQHEKLTIIQRNKLIKVRDCMPAFFDLLKEEPEPSVRVVLGHFVFVYIHPYMDGNGRMG
jgi:Fic family protein